MVDYGQLLSASVVGNVIVLFAVVVAIIVAKHDSFRAFFLSLSNREFYYLSFIHEYAYGEYLSGLSPDEIIKQLRVKRFGFLEERGDEDRKTRAAKNMVESVLNKEDYIKNYLIKKRFDKDDFLKLKKALHGDDKLVHAQAELKTILVNPEQCPQLMDVFVKLHIPPFLDEVNYAGENEMCVMYAAKYLNIIDWNTSEDRFAKCMKALKECYPAMKVVSGKQGINHHKDKDEARKIDSRKKAFLNALK